MDFLYEMIFLGLIDKNQTNRIPRWIRLAIAVLVSVFFIGTFAGISVYVVFAANQTVWNRILFATFMVLIVSYYLHLLKGINKSE